MNVNIDLSQLDKVINPSFMPYLTNKERNLFFYGGAGSGKSIFIAQKILIRIILAIQRGHYLGFACFRKTQPAVRKSVFALFVQQIHAWNLMPLVESINKTDMTIKFVGGCQIMCMGLDDKEKLKSIVGVTDAWLEETTEFSHEDLMQVGLRIRGITDSYKQIICSFNPTSGNHWLNKKCYEKGFGTFVHTTYKDNLFLDKAYKEALEQLATQDENYYRIYVLGEWGELKGLIYPDYKIISVDDIPSEYDTIKLGLDFGFNHPSALVKNTTVGNSMYWQELLHKSNLTTRGLIQELNKLKEAGEIDSYTEIIADSSRPEAIQEIYDEGFNIRGCKKYAGSVNDGINSVRKKDLFITDCSLNGIKEISMYKWMVDKDGNLLDKPVKFLDDFCDAGRYSTEDENELDICEVV